MLFTNAMLHFSLALHVFTFQCSWNTLLSKQVAVYIDSEWRTH